MSRIKEWFLTHIDEFSDEELLKEGYSQEEICSKLNVSSKLKISIL